MSRFVCWLLLGHKRVACGSRRVHVVDDDFGEWDVTDVLYRCGRCRHVFSKRVKGGWTAEQVVASGRSRPVPHPYRPGPPVPRPSRSSVPVMAAPVRERRVPEGCGGVGLASESDGARELTEDEEWQREWGAA